MNELIEILRAGNRDEHVVERLRVLVVNPLRNALPGVPAVDQTHETTPGPCQFLIQQQFGLPDPLAGNVRRVVEGSYTKARPARIPDPADRSRYLGITVVQAWDTNPARHSHRAHVRWGFAIETSPGWGFEKGPNRVFDSVKGGIAGATVFWRPVTNLPTFWLAFVGRQIDLPELETRALSLDEMVNQAARDLRGLYDRLGAAGG
jgi:hypothetical protein